MTLIQIAAPLCAPNREVITGVVQRQLAVYGVRVGRLDAHMFKIGSQAIEWHIDVEVSPQAADWVEYLLLRYMYTRRGAYCNPRNAEWAARHIKPRDPRQPWLGPGCRNRELVTMPYMPGGNPPRPWSETPATRAPRKRKKRGGWFGW